MQLLSIDLQREVATLLSWKDRGGSFAVWSTRPAARYGWRVGGFAYDAPVMEELRAVMARLPQLAALDGTGYPGRNLHPSMITPSLTSLNLSNCCALKHVDPLSICTSLTSLNLSHVFEGGVRSVAPLATCVSLTSLDLGRQTSQTMLLDISPLAACTALQTLILSFAPVRSCHPLLCLSPTCHAQAATSSQTSARWRHAPFCVFWTWVDVSNWTS